MESPIVISAAMMNFWRSIALSESKSYRLAPPARNPPQYRGILHTVHSLNNFNHCLSARLFGRVIRVSSGFEMVDEINGTPATATCIVHLSDHVRR